MGGNKFIDKIIILLVFYGIILVENRKREKMRYTLNNESELDKFLNSHPEKLIGLSKGFGVVYATIYNTWAEIPHDTHRDGIYKNGKLAKRPKGWAKTEQRIENYIGCE